jgi:aerobic carbon-monoxide dehydrogenase large subunit
MSNAVASGTSELLAELRRLCARLPVPQPSWHPYASQIAACRGDFEQALARVAVSPQTLELAVALIDGDAELVFGDAAPPELTVAWRRLEALPLPSGQHPYLDEILPALEAHRLLLVALSHTIAA